MTTPFPKITNSSGFVLVDFIQTIVFALAIFMISYLFLFQPHQVRGHSMDSNFDDGEYLLTEKVTYRFNNPKRGDVIVFNAPVNRRDDYIKRVIALPGETVKVQNGKVYVNQKELPEEYLDDGVRTNPGAFLTEGTEYKSKPDEYIVMGDNRDHSSDSRSWGAISRKDIIGRAWVSYWPPPSIGQIPSQTYNNY